MKVYKVTDDVYSDEQSIWSGEGAKNAGGRWNSTGCRAIYTSPMIDVCIAEKGFYRLSYIFDQYYSRSKQLTADSYKSALNIKLKLACIELQINETEIVSLLDDASIHQELIKIALPTRSITDARLSPYFNLPNRWTQKIGSNLEKQGVGCIKVPSARSDLCSNVIIFPRVFNSDKFNLTSSEEIVINAIDLKGRIWDGKKEPNTKAAIFTYKSESKLVEILDYKIQ